MKARRKVNPLLMKGCALAQMNGILETEVEHLLRRWREDGVQDVDKDVNRSALIHRACGPDPGVSVGS